MWAPVIAFLQEQSKPSLIFNPGTIFNVNKTVRLLRNSKISLIAMHKIYMSRKRIWNELKHDLFHNVLKAWPRNRSDKKYGTSYLSLAILSLQINLEIVFTELTTRNDAQTYLYREDFDFKRYTRRICFPDTLFNFD